MEKEYIYKNLFNVRGTIVHMYEAKKCCIVTISTGEASKIPNYPKIFFFGEKGKEMVKAFKQYDNVEVNAKFERRITKDKEGKINSTNIIIGNEIKASEKTLDGRNPLPYNKFELAGRVVKINKSKSNFIRIIVKTMNGNHYCNIAAFYYTKNCDELLDKLKVNDNIYIQGEVQTKKRIVNNVESHYQGITIKEMNKLE